MTKLNQFELFFYNAGANVGIVLALSLSGYLSSEFGWEYVFYLFGGCSLLWLLFWIILIENKPSQNKRISKVICGLSLVLLMICGQFGLLFEKCVTCHCPYFFAPFSGKQVTAIFSRISYFLVEICASLSSYLQ
jgi:MFS family permease